MESIVFNGEVSTDVLLSKKRKKEVNESGIKN